MTAIQNEMKTIAGLDTHYRTAGSKSNPTLIFLNGWATKLDGPKGSDRVICELAKHFYVICPEAPGLMRSQPPPEVWGFPQYAEHLHAFLQSLEIEKPIMMGHSFGGGAMLMYAYLYPGNVSQLVLVNAAIKGKRIQFFYKTASVLQFVSKRILFPFASLSIARRVLYRVNGVPTEIVTRENLGSYAVMPSVPPAYIASVESVKYPKVTTPTLLVWGTEDSVTPLHWAERALGELPNAKLVTLPGVHGVLYEDPAKVVDIFIEHLNKAN